MKILLLGKYGQVAWELQRALAPLGEVVAVGRAELDFADAGAVRALTGAVRPQLLVNAAAYTMVDQAETEQELCVKINATLPEILAAEARKLGAWLIHYSTDYVFDGAKTTPYVETDPTRPLGVYGAAKLAGERAVGASGADYLLFRVCWVYGARGRNFMQTMRRLAREREKVRVVRDQFGSPTWARMIAGASALAAQQVMRTTERQRFRGIYHLAAGGVASWYEFARQIIEGMPATERKCREVESITSAEYPTPVKRPAYSVLNCDKLEKIFGLRLPHWEHGLQQVLDPS